MTKIFLVVSLLVISATGESTLYLVERKGPFNDMEVCQAHMLQHKNEWQPFNYPGKQYPQVECVEFPEEGENV